MSQSKKPNQLARILAVLALVGAVALVVVVIAGSGDSGGGDTTTSADQNGPTAAGQRAVERGVWIVREGDTLVSISDETGIDLDELVTLNPDIDPQTLATGQRISLRPGEAGSGDSSSSTTTSSSSTSTSTDPAAEFGDGSVADSNNPDTTTTTP